jgi:hypothetical protein
MKEDLNTLNNKFQKSTPRDIISVADIDGATCSPAS